MKKWPPLEMASCNGNEAFLVGSEAHRNEGSQEYSRKICSLRHQPGAVARACNPATWRLGLLNGLRAGFLGAVVLCRSGVHTKFGVNMVS